MSKPTRKPSEAKKRASGQAWANGGLSRRPAPVTGERGKASILSEPDRPGKIVAELREAIAQAQAAGVTRYAIAKRAGIAPIVLARIADGERGMKLETAERIADALGFDLTLLTKRLISGK